MQNINVEQIQDICITALTKFTSLSTQEEEVHTTQIILLQTNLLLIEILKELRKQETRVEMFHRV